MKFKLEKKEYKEKNDYNPYEKMVVKKFAENLERELGDLLFSVVLFGSSARKLQTQSEQDTKLKNTGNKNQKERSYHDIDVLVILNDTIYIFNEELVQVYRLITKKVLEQLNENLHITTLRLTKFWSLIKEGDAVIINILRDALPIYDRGLILPLKALLFSGLIRPSPEAVYVYNHRSKISLVNSKTKILQAVIDLYWAVIDSAHSLLMANNIVPPSPDHVAEYIRKYSTEIGLEKSYAKIVDLFYRIYKQITHKQIRSLKGSDFDNLYEFAREFIDKVNALLQI